MQEVRQNILERHNCDHDEWFNRVDDPPRNGYRCELCEQRFYTFILRCPGCHMQICASCKRSRL